MLRLQRFQSYIFRVLLKYTGAFFVGLNALAWFAQLLKMSKGLSDGTSLLDLIILSLLGLAPVMYYTLPIACILACVYCYTHLVQDRERDILYSAGITPWSLAWPSIVIALYVVIVLYSISFWGSEKASIYIQNHEQKVKQIVPHSWITPGVFLSVGNSTVYIQNKKKDGTLDGILLHERKPKRILVFSGKHGVIHQDTKGLSFTLFDGRCYTIPISQNSVIAPHVMQFKKYTVQVCPKTKPTLKGMKPQSLSIGVLWKYIQDGDFSLPWIRELYTRCITPLGVLPSVLWVTCMILTKQNLRVGIYRRYSLLFLGLVLFQGVQLGGMHLSLFWALVTHLLLFFPIAMWSVLIFYNAKRKNICFL